MNDGHVPQLILLQPREDSEVVVVVGDESNDSRGRYAVAGCDITAGEVVLEATAYAFAVLDSHRKRVCARCARTAASVASEAQGDLDAATPKPSPEVDANAAEAHADVSAIDGDTLQEPTADNSVTGSDVGAAVVGRAPSARLTLRCAQCDQAYFCSSECQKAELDGGGGGGGGGGAHQAVCRALRRLATMKASPHAKSVAAAVLALLARRMQDVVESSPRLSLTGAGEAGEVGKPTAAAGPGRGGWQGVLDLQSHLCDWDAEARTEARRVVRLAAAEWRLAVAAGAANDEARAVGWAELWCEVLAGETRAAPGGDVDEPRCGHGRRAGAQMRGDVRCAEPLDAEVEEGFMHLMSKVESNGFGLWIVPPGPRATAAATGGEAVGVGRPSRERESINAGRALFPKASFFN
ncbi:hypothetical protein HK405_011745, partial [Cladochytrium tenue]